MFQVGNVLIQDDVALVKFQCNISLCKGACCVVGASGAPVAKKEIPVLRKAYSVLKSELRPEAIEVVENQELIFSDEKGNAELACVKGEECVFVVYENDVAICSIQRAFYQGKFDWEKPISCHLFPIRIFSDQGTDFMNYVYVPELCESAVTCGSQEGVYLSDFLEKPLTRKYGKRWYQTFQISCQTIRALN